MHLGVKQILAPLESGVTPGHTLFTSNALFVLIFLLLVITVRSCLQNSYRVALVIV